MLPKELHSSHRKRDRYSQEVALIEKFPVYWDKLNSKRHQLAKLPKF